MGAIQSVSFGGRKHPFIPKFQKIRLIPKDSKQYLERLIPNNVKVVKPLVEQEGKWMRMSLQSCRCWRRYWQVMQERSFTEPDYDKLRTGLSQKYVPMSKNWTYCIPKVLKNGLSTSRVPKTQYSFWNRLFAGQIAACSCSHASDIFHGMKYMAFSENFRYAKKREPLIPTIAMFHGDHEEKKTMDLGLSYLKTLEK